MDLADLFLPPDLEQFVQSKLDSGDYHSRNEVVRDALLFLRERDQHRALKLAELRKLIQVGIEQLDRGEGKVFDADEIKSAIHQRLADEGRLS
jgi:antitoxin ParD1/3/4